MPNAHLWPTARLIYRGYALEVRPANIGWRVTVYPKADLPILRYNEIFSREQHRALTDARDCIDVALKFSVEPAAQELKEGPRQTCINSQGRGLDVRQR